MADYRTCPVKGCENKHTRSVMMCRAHWFSLPKPLRDEVYRAFRYEGIISEAYFDARESAIAFCEGRDPEPV